MEIHAREILKVKERINEMLASHTGQSIEKIKQDTERDYFMSSQEAVEYGLVDRVIFKREAKSEDGR